MKNIFNNKKKMIITLFIIVFLFLSIKPFLFTVNHFISGYYIRVKNEIEKAEKYVYRMICYNPKSYRFLRIDNNIKRIKYLIRTVIFYNDIEILRGVGYKELREIERKYKDNFYFQNILNNLDKKGKWKHLDEVSYFFLREKRYNRLTISILDKLNPEFDKEFLNNILDFLKWQDNIELFKYIKEKYKIKYYEYIKPKNAIKYKDSILKVKDILFKELNIKKELIGDNLIGAPDFEDEKNYLKDWYFSDMSNETPYGEGSFFLGLETIKKNTSLKILNFFINNAKHKANARGGIWYKKGISVYKGFYVLSFDYWTKTGKEKPRLWLWKGITIPWLPCTERRWKKIVYILNNVNGKIKKLKPLIRMFGKGSMYVDNVYLGKLDVEELGLKGQYWFKTVSIDRQNSKFK